MLKQAKISKLLLFLYVLNRIGVIVVSLFFIYIILGFPPIESDDIYKQLSSVKQFTDLNSLQQSFEAVVTRSRFLNERFNIFLFRVCWLLIIILVILLVNLKFLRKMEIKLLQQDKNKEY